MSTRPNRARIPTGGAARIHHGPAVLFALTALALPAAGASSDRPPAAANPGWNEFRGPHRSGVSPETGLLRSWPEGGPPVLWRRPLGEGFSGISARGGTLYTLFADGDKEFLTALRKSDGDELWRLEMGETFRENFGNGPRSTPTIDGGTIYALGARGRLAAVTEGGEVLWQLELQERYPIVGPQELLALAPTAPGPQLPVFGYAGSPLVAGDLLVLETGAGQGKSFVALDKHSGEEKWSALDSEIGYASPVAVEVGGEEQILVLAGTEIVSLSPGGEVLWRYPWAPTTAQPLFLAPDRVFVSTVSGVGAMLLRIAETGSDFEELWRIPRLRNAWNSSIVLGDRVFGFDNATLRCVSAGDGELLWAARGLGQGTLIAADGLLVVLGDRGKLALVDATSDAYRELGSMQLFEGRTWTAPTLAEGRLYVRDQQEIVALDLRSPPPAPAAPEEPGS